MANNCFDTKSLTRDFGEERGQKLIDYVTTRLNGTIRGRDVLYYTQQYATDYKLERALCEYFQQELDTKLNEYSAHITKLGDFGYTLINIRHIQYVISSIILKNKKSFVVNYSSNCSRQPTIYDMVHSKYSARMGPGPWSGGGPPPATYDMIRTELLSVINEELPKLYEALETNYTSIKERKKQTEKNRIEYEKNQKAGQILRVEEEKVKIEYDSEEESDEEEEEYDSEEESDEEEEEDAIGCSSYIQGHYEKQTVDYYITKYNALKALRKELTQINKECNSYKYTFDSCKKAVELRKMRYEAEKSIHQPYSLPPYIDDMLQPLRRNIMDMKTSIEALIRVLDDKF